MPCGRPGPRRAPRAREAQLDEPDEALADPCLLGHEGHREAGRPAQLDTRECVSGDGSFTHGHLGEAPRIGRVGLRPVEPALGKVLRRERVDESHRDLLLSQVAREGHPVVARGLHGHRLERLVLSREPAIESVEAGPVLVDTQDLVVGLLRSLATACHRVLPAPDVDAHRDHLDVSFARPPGGPCRSRSTSADGHHHRSSAAGSRSPFTAGRRGPVSRANGHLPDSRSPVSPWGRCHHRPLHKGLYQPLSFLRHCSFIGVRSMVISSGSDVTGSR